MTEYLSTSNEWQTAITTFHDSEIDLSGATIQTLPEILIHEVHVSVRLALLQVLAVIVGVFMTRAVFMVHGYPESELDWNALALLVRNYGFLLLPLPVAWTSAAIYLENHGTGRWSKRWTVCSGIFLLAALVSLFFWCFCNPYNDRPTKIWIGDSRPAVAGNHS